MKITTLVPLALLSALLPLTAAAQSSEAAAERRGAIVIDDFGMRVGGYGFRSPEGDQRNGWEDCRMNGIGAFAQRRLGTNAFVESGADLYFSESFPLAPAAGQASMDRLSGLLTVAGGLRMFPDARVSAYAQIGGGLELTKIELEHEGAILADQRALPVGFIGLGGDLRVATRLRLGMNLRAYVMGHFDHGHEASQTLARDAGHAGEPTSSPVAAGLQAKPEAAAQAQFYLQYAL